ncbi:hypothetical protein [Corynebacterium sp. A21]|uniref:hypothetical protein n=1 Tax=Corynebacterium sp. A21 TaxID=3457318 RepID=UPI003FCF08BB
MTFDLISFDDAGREVISGQYDLAGVLAEWVSRRPGEDYVLRLLRDGVWVVQDCATPQGVVVSPPGAASWLRSHGYSESETALIVPQDRPVESRPVDELERRRPGRPSLGKTEELRVLVPVDLMEKVDAARGGVSRSEWTRQALEGSLALWMVEFEDIHERRFRRLDGLFTSRQLAEDAALEQAVSEGFELREVLPAVRAAGWTAADVGARLGIRIFEPKFNRVPSEHPMMSVDDRDE